MKTVSNDWQNVHDLRDALRCGRQGYSCSRSTARNVHCPVHGEDRDPSLTVDERDGKVLVNCKTGCAQDAVLAALPERGLWPERRASEGAEAPSRGQRPRPIEIPPDTAVKGAPQGAKLVAEYEYGPDARKGRFEFPNGRKEFRWRATNDQIWGGQPEGTKMIGLPLYHHADLATRPDEPVYFCEGEKATDAARAHGLLAVCGGWGSSQKNFGRAFACLEGREVLLWPDNDKPGWDYISRRCVATLRRSGM